MLLHTPFHPPRHLKRAAICFWTRYGHQRKHGSRKQEAEQAHILSSLPSDRVNHQGSLPFITSYLSSFLDFLNGDLVHDAAAEHLCWQVQLSHRLMLCDLFYSNTLSHFLNLQVLEWALVKSIRTHFQTIMLENCIFFKKTGPKINTPIWLTLLLPYCKGYGSSLDLSTLYVIQPHLFVNDVQKEGGKPCHAFLKYVVDTFQYCSIMCLGPGHQQLQIFKLLYENEFRNM